MASQPQYPFVAQSYNGPPVLPLRRQHVSQPPTLLTTSLNNAHNLGHGLGLTGGQTPLSTTSLSSPFSQHTSSPYTSSPITSALGMATRGPSTYNPQQWGRVTNNGMVDVGPSSAHVRQSSRNATYAPRLRGPDEPMASPPPPYSADPTDPSPAETTSSNDFSHGATPSSTSTAFSPSCAVAPQDRWAPSSPYMQSASPVVPQAAFPPPPSSSTSRIRSSSRNHADRLLAAITLRPKNNNIAQPNAIETLQQNTIQALERTELVLPPAARRAVSADAISDTYSTRSPFDSPIQAERGFPFPPPPPGPPPTGVRSQSMNRVSETSSNTSSLAPPRSRFPPGRGPGLEPVPPTPANWVDSDQNNRESQVNQESWPGHSTWPTMHQLPLEDISNGPSNDSYGSSEATGSIATSHIRRDSSGLVRSPAVRNRSAKGLRERRSESRIGRRQDSDDSSSAHVAVADTLSRPLQDIVTAGGNETLARRRLSTRLTPKSAQFRGLDEALKSAESGPLSGKFTSADSTPLTGTFARSPGLGKATATPSFSPGREILAERRISGQFPIKLNSPSLTVPLTADQRPISHILHIPNDDNVNIQVLPLSPESTRSLVNVEIPNEPDTFLQRAVERHRMFIEKEATASTDSEKLHMFIEHIIAESRIRREKYAKVFEEENLDPADLLDGAFEEPENEAVEAHLTNLSKTASIENSRPSSAATSFADSHSNRTSRVPSVTTASGEPIMLTIDTSVSDTRRKDFVPCLSPIQSMSAVTRDETESRGRAPSRWWESGSNPSMNGDGFKVLERTKRESKYMSAVIENETSPAEPAPIQPPFYGSDEYPPEKMGHFDPSIAVSTPYRSTSVASALFTPELASHYGQSSKSILLPIGSSTDRLASPGSAPFTPDPRKLDISRLITLPPPYPRRHPAINNSHPDLADIRAVIHALNDTEMQRKATEAYEGRMKEKRQRADSLTAHQRSMHDQDIAFRVEQGSLSQQEFDEAETSLEAKAATIALDLTRADFETYQSSVVTPVDAMLKERITRAASAFSTLVSRLHSDSETHAPDFPQAAGDEQPELLEKLTMLKWLFEARESLYRQVFDLESACNDLYKATVLHSYSRPGNQNAAKHADAVAFFKSDALRRKSDADKDSLVRWDEFLSAIEEHTTRGVEVQQSAFWDIAPPLQSLLQRIPTEPRQLRDFEILIPKSEVDENPAYWSHPLRYLYSVLLHADASSRQFVEAQVSLWCILQEVREGAAGARWRAEESKQGKKHGNEVHDARWKRHFELSRGEEVKSGLEDLKEKVAAVEEQWVEGLGGEIVRVKEGVRNWLEGTGGWDEELEEGAE